MNYSASDFVKSKAEKFINGNRYVAISYTVKNGLSADRKILVINNKKYYFNNGDLVYNKRHTKNPMGDYSTLDEFVEIRKFFDLNNIPDGDVEEPPKAYGFEMPKEAKALDL